VNYIAYYIAYLGGGLLVNILCGATIGGIVAVILRHRMRLRAMGILIGITCALVVGASLAVIAQTHGEGLSLYSAGLVIYPFLNRITLGLLRVVIRVPGLDIGIMTLLDAGFMTVSGLTMCKLVIRRQNK
jgi:hypothetical protein